MPSLKLLIPYFSQQAEPASLPASYYFHWLETKLYLDRTKVAHCSKILQECEAYLVDLKQKFLDTQPVPAKMLKEINELTESPIQLFAQNQTDRDWIQKFIHFKNAVLNAITTSPYATIGIWVAHDLRKNLAQLRGIRTSLALESIYLRLKTLNQLVETHRIATFDIQNMASEITDKEEQLIGFRQSLGKICNDLAKEISTTETKMAHLIAKHPHLGRDNNPKTDFDKLSRKSCKQ